MEQLDYLWKRYSDNSATPAEREELYQLIQKLDPETSQFFKSLEEDLRKEVEVTAEEQQRLEVIYGKLETAIKIKPHNEKHNEKVIRLFPQITRIAAALLILFVAGLVMYKYVINKNTDLNLSTDFVAGTEKAMLQLADGSTVPLNGGGSKIPQQGGVQVQSNAGKLAYVSNTNLAETVFNSIITPRGGQYQVTLSDGSSVWLNALSSLRFPTSFIGNERVVELIGEAYFEISRNTDMPFKVRLASGAEVEVLGTHFNIMAYADESSIQTTLVEGSVKVTQGSNSVKLIPNQQARISELGEITVLKGFNVNQAVAWKDNKFVFKNTHIEEIMRQVSRWYNVDVTYEGDVSELTFGGTISRKENVSAVLSLLELTGTVEFKTEGRIITVKKVKQPKKK